MGKKPALIQFSPLLLKDIDLYAKNRGISRNAAVNIACSDLVGDYRQLKDEIERLRNLIVQISMAKVGVNL